ncbi:spore coat protein [Domibacillus robiginosus]|uniref:spore coat protein n=1 Tax=Domibacillus robiginosus TaxID=1071054 RepID=UPI000A6F77DC|nr:spore coat protein [Domibacillus robiginosus]
MSKNLKVPQHLAWHETLELHEVVATASHFLAEFKMQLANVQNPTLRGLYMETIRSLEQNTRDLLPFYEKAPIPMMHNDSVETFSPAPTGVNLNAFYGRKLLIFSKNTVRNYAVALTETATPSLREIFQKHLQKAIELHAKSFNFMLERNYYPAYHLDQLLAEDLKNAKAALSLRR